VGVSVHSSDVDLGFFYDDLAPYGNWVETSRYGWVWTPSAVAVDWRPYEDGHWVWTDQGWLWVSDEPFGWATYHYGRWYDDDDLGWSWVPGYEWAPSWTSWQEGDDYVGWAPLPPSIAVSSGFIGSRLSVAIGPSAYVFVPERNFLAPSLGTYVVPAPRVLPIFHRTRNITAYRFSGGRVFCDGVAVERVGRFHGGRVPRYQVASLGSSFRHRGAQFRGDRVEVFRPRVLRARVDPPIRRAAARRSVVSATEFRAAHVRRTGRAALAPVRGGRAELQARQIRKVTPSREKVRVRSKEVRRAAPPRAVKQLRSRPEHARTVRQVQTSRTRVETRQHGRPNRVRSIRETSRTREVTRQHVRPPARAREVHRTMERSRPPRQTVRTQRVERQTRHVDRQTVRTRHIDRQTTVRTQRERPSQRAYSRPARQQHQNARPPQRQQGRPGRHRPPG